jgi:hypothetical protein
MDRSKFVAIVTGAIAIALSLVYLILVQLLDSRGEMLPAPVGMLGSALDMGRHFWKLPLEAVFNNLNLHI